MPPAVPVIAAIGAKIASGVGSYIAAQGGLAAAAKGAAIAAAKGAAKMAAGALVAKGAEKVFGDEQQQPQAFDEKKANRKAALKAAAGARKRIAQQTQTLLTSPLGGAGASVAKTLLGQ